MNTIVLILIALCFSAFFSGMEISFVSANKLLIEMERQKNSMYSWLLSLYYSRPDRFISTVLVGNNIALVIYGIKMADLLKPMLEQWVSSATAVGVLQTLISTLVILVAGEWLPKTLCKLNPNFWLKLTAYPTLLIYVLLYPISWFMSALSNAIMRLFGVKTKNDNHYIVGKVDLDSLLQESVEHVENKEVENEVKLFQNALDFSKVKLRNCMVPRTELVAVDYDTSLEELTEEFVESGCSKILVYRENIDDIIGYIHTIELFKRPAKWQDKIMLVPVVPETMPANKLMNLLLLKKKSMAIVVDEFGGTAGVVTLEDIVEEIFGEIEDEHDTQDYVAKQLNDKEYVLSGRLEVDDVNDRFGLQLPVSEEYMTIAGWVLYICQGFPKAGAEIDVKGYKLKILRATPNKIELVKLIKD
ncbi:MAG: HlyC/CorC family transporter [Paludibacteraceae bacterium]|nr:HlyC/CorC family transporter [Paludibacteraceae bacterium]